VPASDIGAWPGPRAKELLAGRRKYTGGTGGNMGMCTEWGLFNWTFSIKSAYKNKMAKAATYSQLRGSEEKKGSGSQSSSGRE